MRAGATNGDRPPTRPGGPPAPGARATDRRPGRALDVFLTAVRRAYAADHLAALTRVVRRAARELVRADGATFVLRDGHEVYYADEDAIGPLWMGQRFPIAACVSGLSILGRRPIIEDIYRDPRVPHAAYRPTFVRSLAMVPIGSARSIGAIGAYWARRHRPSPRELRLLLALADLTSVHRQLAWVSRFAGSDAEAWAIEQAYAALPRADFSRDILGRCPPILAVTPLTDGLWSDWGTPERVASSLARAGRPPWWLAAEGPIGTAGAWR